MTIVYDFGNPQNWYLKGYWEFPAVPRPEGGYYSIPPNPLGVTLTDRWFVVRLLSALAQPTWFFGGTLARLYNFPMQTILAPVGMVEDEPKKLLVNRAILFGEDQKLSAPFDLYWSPPRWLPEARLDLWTYIGPERDLLFDLTGRVEDTQLEMYEAIAEMQQKIKNIERRIP